MTGYVEQPSRPSQMSTQCVLHANESQSAKILARPPSPESLLLHARASVLVVRPAPDVTRSTRRNAIRSIACHHEARRRSQFDYCYPMGLSRPCPPPPEIDPRRSIKEVHLSRAQVGCRTLPFRRGVQSSDHRFNRSHILTGAIVSDHASDVCGNMGLHRRRRRQ